VGTVVETAKKLANGWDWDSVSVGIPSPVHGGRVVAEPINLGAGWVGFDYELPPSARLGSNKNAFAGGFRLWDPEAPAQIMA
jgi:hypothetical protein